VMLARVQSQAKTSANSSWAALLSLEARAVESSPTSSTNHIKVRGRPLWRSRFSYLRDIISWNSLICICSACSLLGSELGLALASRQFQFVLGAVFLSFDEVCERGFFEDVSGLAKGLCEGFVGPGAESCTVGVFSDAHLAKERAVNCFDYLQQSDLFRGACEGETSAGSPLAA